MLFEDEVNWIYWCSCDIPRASLVTNLSHRVGRSYYDLCENECLHVTASKYILEELDAVHMIFPTLDFDGKI